MFSLPAENWVRLFVWLALGLAIYFGYSKKHSLLAHPENEPLVPRRDESDVLITTFEAGARGRLRPQTSSRRWLPARIATAHLPRRAG